MKSKIFLYSILCLLGLSSCSDQKPVFEKYHSFENATWDRFNQIIFTMPLEEESQVYDISFVIKPTNKFEYNYMPVYVILTTPSGEERMADVKVPVKENGTFIGAEEGKPVVIKSSLWKGISIQDVGNCKLSIENMIPKIQTLGIAEIGIVVEKSEKK